MSEARGKSGDWSGIRFENCEFSGFLRSGIEAPADVDLHIENSRFSGSGSGVRIGPPMGLRSDRQPHPQPRSRRDPRPVLKALGLADAPIEQVREALEMLQRTATAPTLNKRKAFRSTRLFAHLVENGADVMTITSKVVALASDPDLPALLYSLGELSA